MSKQWNFKQTFAGLSVDEVDDWEGAETADHGDHGKHIAVPVEPQSSK